MSRISYSFLFLIIFFTQCSYQKTKTANIVRQGEKGSLQLTAIASHDSIRSDKLEDLRFYITLQNKYPFSVQSLKYFSFLECNVQKDGKYFHTVDSPIEPIMSLTTMWQEVFPSDTSITITIFVDIEKISQKKGHKQIEGNYSIQGIYANNLIAENKKYPTWIGTVRSNFHHVIIVEP